MVESFINQFKNWTLFEKLWIAVFTVMLLVTSYLWQDNLFGVVTTLTGMLCVVLVAKGNIWNYFWGFINVLGYSYIAYNANYAGDFVLNLFYYLPMQFIGYFMWRNNVSDEIVEVKSFTIKNWVISIIQLVIGTYIISLLMPQINALFGMDANPLPLVDSFTSFGSIFAMYLMARRFTEQWIIWIVVNIMAIVMWVRLGDSSMVIMWSAYLLNSIYGYYNWRKLGE